MAERYFDLGPYIEEHGYEHIALQFSGGKDSAAALYLLRDHWPWLRVYWTDTGDAPPDVYYLMAKWSAILPNFTVIPGRRAEVQALDGWPLDIVPVPWTRLGQELEGQTPATFQGRYDCCFRSIMLPMQRRMVDDGITLVLRGQRRADRLKAPIPSGWVDPGSGITYLFPLDEWSTSEVWSYLALTDDLRIPESYDYLGDSVDCLHCTAYWMDGRQAYLKARHPDAFEEVSRRMNVAWTAIRRTMGVQSWRVGGGGP